MPGRIVILIVCLSGFFGQMWGQITHQRDSLPYLSDIYNERFYLQTDRYIYTVGERILFRAFNTSHPEIQKENWSKVLYIELIKPDGTSVKKAKFPLTKDGAYGYLEVPENLLAGNYYVAVYTKWMMNFHPSNYTFNMIKIINPFKSQLEESCIIQQNYPDTLKAGDRPDDHTRTQPVLNKNIIFCHTDKNRYHQREKVTVNINIPKDVISSLTGCCMFVVRPGITDTMVYSFLSPDSVEYHRSRFLNYIPETRGISICGKVVSKEDREPLMNTHLQLSVLNDNSGFSEYSTRKNGEFIFVLDPLKGNHDMFITANHQTGQSMEIFIDNDFSTDPVKFNNKPFTLSEPERERAKEIMINMQINKFYSVENSENRQSEIQNVTSENFYGKPSNVVYIDDYIELPTLEEVFIELVPEVYPVIRKKKTELIIKNEYYSNQSLPFGPLILVDRLPISDLEKVLLLPPSRIQRIEVVNELFLQGDFFYGGIISIFTKDNNLAGIDLPGNSFFFSFQNFEDQEAIKFPDYTGSNSAETNLPDYRNCLYWDPDLQINSSQPLQLNFYTSDSRGEFKIYIRGVTKEGEILEGTCTFQVEATNSSGF